MNVAQRTLSSTRTKLPQVCFPFAVPTLGDYAKRLAYTVDWQKYKLFRYENGIWSTAAEFKGL